jgi:hypothetical protein
MRMRKQIRVNALWRFRPDNMTEEEEIEEFNTLRPSLKVIHETRNLKDPGALLVTMGMRKVGYINADDKRWVWPALRRGRRSAEISFAHIIPGRDGESAMLGYAIEVDTDEVRPTVPADNWEHFSTTFPELDFVEDIDMLDYAFEELLCLLQKGTTAGTSAEEYADIICTKCRHDMSVETTERLVTCAFLLEQRGTPEDLRLKERLERASTHRRGRVGKTEHAEWFDRIVRSESAGRMLKEYRHECRRRLGVSTVSHTQMCRDLERLEQELLMLPGQLCSHIDEPSELIHELAYKEIGREKQLEVLSALVLRKRLKELTQGQATDGNTTAAADTTPEPPSGQSCVLPELMPFFWGDITEVNNFVQTAMVASNQQITLLVNRLIKEKRMVREMCGRRLWTVLHKAGIYTCTESNWNYYVRSR